MKVQPKEAQRYLSRFLLVLLVSVFVAWVISELGLLFQQDRSTARPPQQVELVIPAGTAEKVAAGEAAPGIPGEMTFVLGDVLVVRNEDSETHTLGPLLIPAGANASLPLNEADNFSMTCSFNSSSYMGLTVRPPTTLRTRLVGISFAAVPTAGMLFVYSLLIFPLKPKTA
ncbi:MAG TPA: hypothetical protein PLC52_05110 [Anaerolineales bacterium]|nr:hypothetical protein [Anaerolineales bacterium]HRQ92228.1 hypothetical protein [Anaerolineales bacterium]